MNSDASPIPRQPVAGRPDGPIMEKTMSKSPVPALVSPKLSAPFQVPLSALVLDAADNVRDASTVTMDGIKQMAAMLQSYGQLSALLVSKRENGTYTVHAGGRRTRGFQLLLEQGKISADHLVDVREVDASAGLDLSLIENISQEQMHPVDQFFGYKRLADKGLSAEQVAKAFGVKVLDVKRRMKLADVHPQLLQDYRSGKDNIRLDHILALASCPDQERQLQIWSSLHEHQRTDQFIRRCIAQDRVAVSDDRVQLVGLQAYLAAGGAVEQDLFSESGKAEYLTDPGLLDMLVAERLEASAEQLRGEGWAWVEVVSSFGYDERQKFGPYPTTYLPETAEHVAQREALERQIEEKENAAGSIWGQDDVSDEDEAQAEKLQAEANVLEEQIEALKESRIDLSGVDMLIAGAVVFLSGSEIVVHKPMIKAEDRAALTKAQKNKQGACDASGAGARPITEVEQQAEGMSDRLIMNLTAHKTAAVQACLVANQKVALAALAAHMAKSLFDRFSYATGPIKINLTTQEHVLKDASPTFVGSAAQQALLAEHDAIQALLPENSSEFLQFFIEQDLSVSLRLIAYATALTVSGVRGKNATQDDLAALASAVSLDMRQWWAPTQANYLALVPKSKMIEAVVEAHGGPLAAAGWDKLKKDEVLDRCTDSLKGTGWLPAVLR